MRLPVVRTRNAAWQGLEGNFVRIGADIVKLISFLATLPAKQLPNPDSPKIKTLMAFAEGARLAGEDAVVSTNLQYEPCDVAVILGYVHDRGKRAPHLELRQQILDRQREIGARTVIADSNLFLYRDTDNPLNLLRYSFDGVFPGQGEYCDSRPSAERWAEVAKIMDIHVKPWRTQGSHILVCLQRDGGWSMNGYSVVDWTMQTLTIARQCSSRPIRLRAHPGDRQAPGYLAQIMQRCARMGVQNVSVSEPKTSLVHDLQDCWAVINHNSSPAVAAAIEGIPVFATDPALSQAREVANRNLERLENPMLFDRELWLQRLAQFHWSHDDLKSGRCWQHMRQWVKARV